MPDPRLPRGAIARRKTGVLLNALCSRFALVLTLGVAAAALLSVGGAAEAAGRAGPPAPSIYALGWRDGAPAIAAGAAWRGGSLLAAEARRWIGSRKFTGLPGPWCADAVSAWLKAIGRPPLPNRLAASALNYGPRVADPWPGDLVVMRTRRGPAGHVGIVAGVNADGSIEIISGNWRDRVARSTISRAAATAFVRV
jgi:uncharacterized protein (TIGR02594 family)